MLSTAWSRTDPFWNAWSSDDDSSIRFKITADIYPMPYPDGLLEKERARARIIIGANISAFPPVVTPVRLAGSCTSRRHRFTFP